MSNSLWFHGLQPTRTLCLWDFPAKNTGVSCHFLLQGIFLTQGSNPSLQFWQADSLPLSHQEVPCQCYIVWKLQQMQKYAETVPSTRCSNGVFPSAWASWITENADQLSKVSHTKWAKQTSWVKDLPASAGDTGLITGPGRPHMLRGNKAHVPQPLSTHA